MKVEQVFDSFNQYHVLVIGDVMIDSYLWGSVSRISPEAPVPIISTVKRENRLGGAANVALNIQSLGATPILCGIVGKDSKGKIFEKLMHKRDLISRGLVYTSQRKTTVKTRIISQNQHLLRVDEEESDPVSANLTESLLKRITALLSEYNINAVIFEDYDKGVITPELIKEVVSLSREKSIPTLVDPKKRNFMNFTGVTFFKPNFKEFKEGMKTDISKDDRKEIVNAAKKFSKEKDIRMLMITLAEKGLFISHDEKHSFIPAKVRNISDVSGAGDTVISVSTLCLAAGLPAETIAHVANLAGGLVCEMPGVVPVDKQRLLEECKSNKIFED